MNRPRSRPSLTHYSWPLAMGAAILALVVSFVSSAHAAPVSVTGGFLNWGFKESFRAYITGPIAQGAISVSGGATRNSDGTFRFPAASGSHDSTAGITSASFNGSVRFTGHNGELDTTLGNPRIQLSGSTGILIVDITTRSDSGTGFDTFPNTEFATLNLAGISPVTTGNMASWSNVPTTLTAAGASAFSGFYSAGQALDPASFTLELGAASTPTGTPTATPTLTSTLAMTSTATATPIFTGTPTRSPTLTSTAVATSTGTATTGPTATITVTATTPPIPTNGLTWKVSENAWTSSSLSAAHQAGAPAVKDPNDGFVFPVGQVAYNPATGATNADFQGSLTLGNIVQGGYRIRLANPSVVIDGQRAGSVIADVSHCVPPAGSSATVSQTFCQDASNYSSPVRVTVVTFTADPAAITDTGSHVSWTFTPDYPLQNDPANPNRRQFPQSFLNALPTSLQAFFRDTGSPSDVNKPPAPVTVKFAYVAPPTATPTASPTTTRTATATPPRTATTTATLPAVPSATPLPTSTTALGGRGFTLTTLTNDQVRLSWSSGTGQSGYRLMRLTSQGEAPIAELPGSATSFVDSMPPSLMAACYRLAVQGADNAQIASSDVLCKMNIATGSPATEFAARLHQSNVAALSWAPPAAGGQTSYILYPLGTVRAQPLPGNATVAIDNTNGSLTCYLVAAAGPSGFIGFTDAICVVPGMSVNLAFSSQETIASVSPLRPAPVGARLRAEVAPRIVS